MIRWFTVFAFVSVSAVAASLAATGCSGGVSDKPAETAASNQAITTTSEHGPVKILATALGSVTLSPTQRTEIQKLFAESDARHATGKEQSKAARTKLLQALATQVEQGRIDRAALAPEEQALDAAWKSSRNADRAAVEKLHDLLEPGQRVALVDAIQLRKGDGSKGGRGDGKAHGAWGKRGHQGKERLAKLADELKLSEDQKTKIGDAVRAERGKDKPHHAQHGKLEAVLTAFKGDRFKMDEVAPATEFHEPQARTIRLAEIAVPLLTPEQRTMLAAKIRDRAQKTD